MSVLGSVKWFNARKGYGFVNVLSQDVPQASNDLFVHASNLSVPEDCYRTLFPGEYVSFSIGKGKDGRDTCLDVTGVQGGPLLTQNTEYFYRVTQRYDRKSSDSRRSETETAETTETSENPMVVEEGGDDPEASED